MILKFLIQLIGIDMLGYIIDYIVMMLSVYLTLNFIYNHTFVK